MTRKRRLLIPLLVVLGFLAMLCGFVSVLFVPSSSRTAKVNPLPIQTDSLEPPKNRPESPPILSGTVSPSVVSDSPKAITESRFGSIEKPSKSAVEPITKIVTATASTPRTWSDATGRFSVFAVLVNQANDEVELQRIDNSKRIKIPISKLSIADQEHLAEQKANPSMASSDKDEAIADDSPPSTSNTLAGKVVRVMDGDTILLKDQIKGDTTIRFNGIDAPEKDQRFGKDALAWLSHEVSGKQVRAEVTGQDRYGRSLADVYIGDRWLNRELVAAGLAWHYVQYSDDARLAEAQHDASRGALGLWQDARRVAPWDYRNGVRTETALPVNAESIRDTDDVVYLSETGNKYHRKSCRTLKSGAMPIPLSRATSAYEPCKICNP